VQISINTVSCGDFSEDKPTLVICHGLANAWGCFVRCLGPLSKRFNVMAIDWVGNGRSSRPPYQCKNYKEAETHHVEALEAWRKAKGVEKMVLLGHSFGGYMTACYALKYPERVSHLVLVSPVGVPMKPKDYDTQMKNRPYWKRCLFAVAKTVLRCCPTPQACVRCFGPIGPRLINTYVHRRFGDMPEDDSFDLNEFRDALAQYKYHSMAGKGSSEFALTHVCETATYVYDPLSRRLGDLAMPVSFIYGDDKDWMDSKHATRLVQSSSHGPIASAEVVRIPGAGHNINLDRPNLFSEAVCRLVLSPRGDTS